MLLDVEGHFPTSNPPVSRFRRFVARAVGHRIDYAAFTADSEGHNRLLRQRTSNQVS